MLHSDSRYPGWAQDWDVVEGDPPGWKLAGVFETLQEAGTAAADAGYRYVVRWGNYEQHYKEFIRGNSR